MKIEPLTVHIGVPRTAVVHKAALDSALPKRTAEIRGDVLFLSIDLWTHLILTGALP